MQNILDTTKDIERAAFNKTLHNERLSGSDTFNIAFFSDTHLGYKDYIHTNAEGINLRELDGDRAIMEIVQGVIKDETPVHAVVHGGDFFHRTNPSTRNIRNFKICLNMFANHGIPFYGQAGNHDVSDVRSDMTPVALLDDPDRRSFALWTPYQAYQIHDGIFLHAVSHHGIKGDNAPEITPISDGLNIFSTHGAALDPKNNTLMRCIDSVREQIIPSEMVIDDNFIAKLLGHYHKRYAVGGGMFNTWYAGSTVRRGFSDDEGARGWMLVKIHPDGKVDIENRNIRQRPQHDLDVIDANGLTAAEVQEMIETNIMSTGVDTESAAFDELNAPIVRQKVINVPRSLRAGLNNRRFAEMTRNMLEWKLELKIPESVEVNKLVDEHGHEISSDSDGSQDNAGTKATPTLTNGRAGGGAVDFFDHWVKDSSILANIPETKQENIMKQARRHLEIASENRGK